MVEVRLLMDAIAHSVLGGVFLTVGIRLASRPVWEGDRLAVQAFGAWWFLYGVQALLTAARTAIVAGGYPEIGLFMLLFSMETVLAFLALGGLTTYIAYLWRGRYLPVALVFGGLGVIGFAYVMVLQWHTPLAVSVESFRADVVFATPMGAGLRWGLILGYYVPVLALAGLFAYLSTISQRPQRKRAVAVAGILAALAGADAVALGPHEGGAWTVTSPLLTLGAAVAAAGAFLRRPS